MDQILEIVKGFCNMYLTLLLVAIGLFTFFVDGKSLKDKKLPKEEKLAKRIGVACTVLGPVLFVVGKFL